MQLYQHASCLPPSPRLGPGLPETLYFQPPCLCLHSHLHTLSHMHMHWTVDPMEQRSRKGGC